MNNKIFSYMMATALALGFAACSPSEEDDIFDHSAAERLNTISGEYSARLTDSKGGWVMEYYPYTDNENFITGMGYLIMNRFNSDGSVYTVMKNKASYDTKWEDTSAWEVITDMGPVLSYNTWNKCIGRFTDPVDIDLTPGEYSKDESGKGFQGDYEFVMVDVPENGDHIMLKGKKRGLYQRLTRIPEGTDFEAYLDDIKKFNDEIFVDKCPYEMIMTDGGQRYKVNCLWTKRATIYPEGTDSVAYGRRNPFLVTKNNDKYYLRFKDSVMVDKHQMEQEYVYNSNDDKFYGVTDATSTIEPAYNNAITFLQEKLNAGRYFNVFRNKSGEVSEKMKQYLDAASNGMTAKNKSYKIDSVAVKKDGDNGAIWQFKYQKGSSAKYIAYKYTTVVDGNSIAFNFVRAESANGTNIMNTVPAINTLMTEVLSRKFVFEKYITLFNVTKIKVTAVDDPDIWFVINY